MRPRTAALVGALALAGCSIGDDDGAATSRDSPAAKRGEPPEATAIRRWSAAINAGRYRLAASFFADGAIVEQVEELRLPDRDAAIAFNRSLPCRADVTDVKDEGTTIVAAFRLRDGPRGRCEGGSARVRFLFRRGKFAEWRQLVEPTAPPGQAA